MNVQASIGIPARCEISTIGVMSLRCVRAAQFGLILSFFSAISRARRSTPAACVPPAPGSPMSAVSMPSASIKCRSSSFCSTGGSETDGDCNPSRSVSSSMPI